MEWKFENLGASINESRAASKGTKEYFKVVLKMRGKLNDWYNEESGTDLEDILIFNFWILSFPINDTSPFYVSV